LPPQPGERVFADTELIQVFTTSGLGPAMQQVSQSYLIDNPTSARVQLTFGMPKRLIDQIQAGYPADVLAWNDPAAEAMIRQANVLDGDPRVLARGRLVLVAPPGNPQHITSLKDLANPGTRWVSARADTLLGAAIGRLLDNAARQPGYDDTFRQAADRNVQLRAEGPAEVLESVSEGGAAAGMVHAEDIPLDKRNLIDVIDLPDDVNAIDDYSIGVVARGPNPAGARTFVAYVASPAAQAIFAKYGFLASSPASAGVAPASPTSR